MKEAKKICIVTPGYISSNPRVVKEADALAKAGFNVRVVFSEGGLDELIGYDYQLLKQKNWQYDIVKWSPLRKKEKFLHYKTKLRHFAARRLPGCLYRFSRFAEFAEGRVYKELAKLAALKKADIYIGHYPAGLAAAAYAARQWEVKLGYDSEDLHTGEFPENSKKTQRVKIIEQRYLPLCSIITASSALIGSELMSRYKVKKPLVIYNVFPLEERKSMGKQKKEKKRKEVSFYWYSQVIGLDRGIQDLIKAARLVKGNFQIHLRGHIREDVQKKLKNLAKKNGVEKKLYFHSFIRPGELLFRAAEHDVGFALEWPVNRNRNISVSNKMFFYMLAGLAIAATGTAGQKQIMENNPQIGFLYKPGNYEELAAKLNELILSPGKLAACKEASLEAAEKTWNWERESKKLTENISKILEKTCYPFF